MPREITPRELALRKENGEQIILLDVRQPVEHQIAALPQSVLIPLHELPQRWQEIHLNPGETLVAYCHHGMRSWHAAQFLESAGLVPVLSLAGGVDAWSCDVDPTVPRY